VSRGGTLAALMRAREEYERAAAALDDAIDRMFTHGVRCAARPSSEEFARIAGEAHRAEERLLDARRVAMRELGNAD